MSLVLNKFDYTPISRKEINGKRLYQTPDGNAVASVTTILDATKDKTHLIAWRKRVGEKKAQEITTEAAGVGTRMHTYLEKYIETGEWPQAGSNPFAQQAHAMAEQIFKQSNKPKKAEWVFDYYLQLVAYAEAHNEIYGTNICEGHVFMCCRDLTYQQFDIWPDEYAEWRQEWYNRVYQYYEQQA